MESTVIIHNVEAGQWLYFRDPYQIITTKRIDEVLPALKLVEDLVHKHGWYAAGFVSYDAASAFDGALPRSYSKQEFPLLWFGLYPLPEKFKLPNPDFQAYSLTEPVPSISQSEYDYAIYRIKDYIKSGDTYQVNFTLRLKCGFQGDPWHLFLAMVSAQSACYAAWIDTGRYAICSASPELFFCLDKNKITCKPMKGTIRRGRTLAEDIFLAERLHLSEKNRAENVMIVDMIRNDLGRVAEVGSVQVPRMFEVERHPTLWQMTSTVTAVCRKSLVEIMEALFPCASITGAPKIRTTRIISELEQSPRGIYTGCIGFITPHRYAQFNVAIRTAVVDRLTEQIEYGSGSGIVWDSLCRDEYKETLLKARVLIHQCPEFSLLETLRWTPEESYFLLDYHLRRLTDSAAYFGFSVDIAQIKNQLAAIVPGFGREPRRVRMVVASDGTISFEVESLNLQSLDWPVRVILAREPVNSADVFLYHKTTYRKAYERARRTCPDCDDVLLWNEKGELTETCFANLVLEIDNELITPPVDSGLLAGTFRAWLLDHKKIKEQRLTIEDLERCSKIYLINSVRKWQEAELCPGADKIDKKLILTARRGGGMPSPVEG